MTAEDIWRRKADEEVVVAAQQLNDYTDEGKRMILAEVDRRQLSLPVFRAEAQIAVVESKSVATGVGGWLALLVFGLLLMGPLLNAARISTEFMSAEIQYPELESLPQWAALKTATWSAFLGFALMSVYAGWGLARRRDWSVVQRARVILWLVGPVSQVVVGMLMPLVTLRTITSGKDSELIGSFVGSFIMSVIVAAVWTSYLSNSKRVRATYNATLLSRS